MKNCFHQSSNSAKKGNTKAIKLYSRYFKILKQTEVLSLLLCYVQNHFTIIFNCHIALFIHKPQTEGLDINRRQLPWLTPEKELNSVFPTIRFISTSSSVSSTDCWWVANTVVLACLLNGWPTLAVKFLTISHFSWLQRNVSPVFLSNTRLITYNIPEATFSYKNFALILPWIFGPV